MMKRILLLFIAVLLPVTANAANQKVTDMTENTAVDNADVIYIVDDPGGTPASNKMTVLNLFDTIDTFAELDAIVSDKAMVNKADGAIWLGVHDYGGATSMELVNNATPTTDATGEIALDITITDHQPLWQYYDGGENMTVIAVDTAQLPATDNEIIKYDAGTDKFVFEADVGGVPGGADTQLQYNSSGSFGGLATLTWDGTDFLLGSGTITKLQLRDAAIYIQSANDGFLDLEADTGIRLNGPTDLGANALDCDSNTVTLSTVAGAVDAGGATSTELVNSAAPTTNAAGEIALDTTITDHQPLWQYYDGGENMTVIAVDTAQLPATDNEIIKYDAATDKFVLEADAGGGGGFNWTFEPQTAKLPTSNPVGIDAGNLRWRGLFDDTTDECAQWSNTLKPYNAGTLQAQILYTLETTSSSDIVEFELSIMCVTGGSPEGDAQDVDSDSFGTTDDISSGSITSTAGRLVLLTDASLNGDSCAENDLIIVRICRDADDTDTTADDVELRGVWIGE